MNWKISFVIAVTSLSCASPVPVFNEPKFKIYEIKTGEWCEEDWCKEKGQGLVRKQEKEVLSFSEADGYFAVSPASLKFITESCPRP